MFTIHVLYLRKLDKNLDNSYNINKSEELKNARMLCTYQCKSREGGVRATGGDLMPETIPPVGFLIVRSDPGLGHLTLTDRSLVPIQNRLPSPSLKAF